MKVRKLLEILGRAPNPEAKVALEGCDCADECTGASVDSDGDLVLRRESGCFLHDKLELLT